MASPLEHEKVPKHRVLSTNQAKVLLRSLGLSDTERFPKIPYSDPVLEAMRVEGTKVTIDDIIEIERPSLTTETRLTWRVVSG